MIIALTIVGALIIVGLPLLSLIRLRPSLARAKTAILSSEPEASAEAGRKDMHARQLARHELTSLKTFTRWGLLGVALDSLSTFGIVIALFGFAGLWAAAPVLGAVLVALTVFRCAQLWPSEAENRRRVDAITAGQVRPAHFPVGQLLLIAGIAAYCWWPLLVR